MYLCSSPSNCSHKAWLSYRVTIIGTTFAVTNYIHMHQVKSLILACGIWLVLMVQYITYWWQSWDLHVGLVSIHYSTVTVMYVYVCRAHFNFIFTCNKWKHFRLADKGSVLLLFGCQDIVWSIQSKKCFKANSNSPPLLLPFSCVPVPLYSSRSPVCRWRENSTQPDTERPRWDPPRTVQTDNGSKILLIGGSSLCFPKILPLLYYCCWSSCIS